MALSTLFAAASVSFAFATSSVLISFFAEEASPLSLDGAAHNLREDYSYTLFYPCAIMVSIEPSRLGIFNLPDISDGEWRAISRGLSAFSNAIRWVRRGMIKRIVVVIAILASLLLNGGLLLLLLFSFKVDSLALAQNAGTIEGEQYLSVQLLSHNSPLEKIVEESESESESESKSESDDKVINRIVDQAPLLLPGNNRESGLSLIAATESKGAQVEVIERRKPIEEREKQIDSSSNIAKQHRENDERRKADLQPRQEKGKLEVNKNPSPQKRHIESESLSQEAPAIERSESEGRRGDQFAQALMNTILHNIEGCYPEASKRRGEEGVVELALQRVGETIEVILLKSSGYGRLDRCAITSVERALKKSQIKELPAKRVKLKPIRFQLR